METHVPKLSHAVFVYGTLRSGYWNNKAMTRDGGKAEMVGTAATLGKFLLFESGIPFVVKSDFLKALQPYNHLTGQIVGELWNLDDKALANCDRLESHPTGYCREETRVQTIKNRAPDTAWLYFYPHFKSLHDATLLRPSRSGLLDWALGHPRIDGSLLAPDAGEGDV